MEVHNSLLIYKILAITRTAYIICITFQKSELKNYMDYFFSNAIGVRKCVRTSLMTQFNSTIK